MGKSTICNTFFSQENFQKQQIHLTNGRRVSIIEYEMGFNVKVNPYRQKLAQKNKVDVTQGKTSFLATGSRIQSRP